MTILSFYTLLIENKKKHQRASWIKILWKLQQSSFLSFLLATNLVILVYFRKIRGQLSKLHVNMIMSFLYHSKQNTYHNIIEGFVRVHEYFGIIFYNYPSKKASGTNVLNTFYGHESRHGPWTMENESWQIHYRVWLLPRFSESVSDVERLVRNLITFFRLFIRPGEFDSAFQR